MKIEKSNILNLEPTLLKEIEVVTAERVNILLAFCDNEFLYLSRRSGTAVFLLEDWSEISFNFDQASWQPYCSDEKYLFLAAIKPKGKHQILVWDKVKDSEVILLDECATRPPQSRDNPVHRTNCIYSDNRYLYSGLSSGIVCIWNKNDWV